MGGSTYSSISYPFEAIPAKTSNPFVFLISVLSLALNILRTLITDFLLHLSFIFSACVNSWLIKSMLKMPLSIRER